MSKKKSITEVNKTGDNGKKTATRSEGRKFSSEYQPHNNGRKKSQITLIQQHLGVELDEVISREDARNMIRALFLKPVSELEALVAKPANNEQLDKIPSVLVGFIQSWLGAVKSGDFIGIKMMLDSAFGVDTFKGLGGDNGNDPNTLDETDLAILTEARLINAPLGF